MGGRVYVGEGRIGMAQSLKPDAVAAHLVALHNHHQEQIKCLKAFQHTRKLSHRNQGVAMINRYFLSEARRMGWHLVPVARRQEWLDLIARWDRNEWMHDEIVHAFGYCRVDGHTSDWSFTDPAPCSDAD